MNGRWNGYLGALIVWLAAITTLAYVAGPSRASVVLAVWVSAVTGVAMGCAGMILIGVEESRRQRQRERDAKTRRGLERGESRWE